MKLAQQVTIIFLCIFVLGCSFLKITSSEAQQRALASSNLTDVNYNFDQTKLDAANDAFHFLRSYVDYFYLITKTNMNQFKELSKLTNTTGWCVGDAHAENFGVLIQKNGTGLFTMNDMDDAGPCPISLDLFRFMVGSKLYNQQIDLSQILKNYQRGLDNKSASIPSTISDMLKKSAKRGFEVDPDKVSGNQLIRDDQSTAVSTAEAADIKTQLQNKLGSIKILDLFKTQKVGGGSGGLTRYEFLTQYNGALLHLEIKEEVTPSIYPVATSQIPPTAQRIQTSISMEQGDKASPLYFAIKLSNMEALVRPRFHANIGIKLDKQSDSDNIDIINYEAYTLGLIHRKSIQNLQSYEQQLTLISESDIEADVEMMRSFLNNKYLQLKH